MWWGFCNRTNWVSMISVFNLQPGLPSVSFTENAVKSLQPEYVQIDYSSICMSVIHSRGVPFCIRLLISIVSSLFKVVILF